MKMKSSLIALAIPLSLLVSCNNGGNEPKSKYTQEDIALNKTILNLEKGASDVLSIANAELAKEVTWASSDTKIATVDKGTVYAIEAGSAKITVSFETLSSSCTVTVKDPHYAPIITFDTDEVDIKVGSSYKVDATVTLNGIDVTNESTFTFTSDGVDEYIELTPNKNSVTIKALKEHDTSGIAVLCNAKYKDTETSNNLYIYIKEAAEEITIVSNTEEIKPSGDGFKASIFVGNVKGFENKVTPNFTVYKNGKPVISPTLEYENDNPDICRYVYGDNIIQSISSGRGTVKVKFEGQSFPIVVDVGVPNVLIENDQYTLELARPNGSLELGKELVDYLQDGIVTSVTYEGKEIFTSYDPVNKIITYDADNSLRQTAHYSSSVDDFSKEMIIKADAAVFTCKKVCCLGMLIKTRDDLKTISGATSTDPKYGLYVLNNDIDCGYSMSSPLYCNGAWGDTGFKGTLDGNSKTIKNLYVKGQGFFGNIGSGAVIKNINFVDCGMADHVNGLGATYSPFFARHCYSCTIQNVNIKFADIFGNKQMEKDIDKDHHALPDHRIQNEEGLLFSIMNGGNYTFKDVTIDATADAVCDDNIVGSKGNVHTAFAAMCSFDFTKSTFNNVLIKVKYYSQFGFKDQIDNYKSMYKDNTKVAVPSGVTIQGTPEEVFKGE